MLVQSGATAAALATRFATSAVGLRPRTAVGPLLLAGVGVGMRAAIRRFAVRAMRRLARRTLTATWALTGRTACRWTTCPWTSASRRIAIETNRPARFETGDRLKHDISLEHALDLAQQTAFVWRHQR